MRRMMQWGLSFWVLSFGFGHALAQVPALKKENMQTDQLERITLGGGCFWCLEAVIERLPGVREAVSGYAGGHVPNPTYEQVCTKTTGHAEVIQIEFDPKVIPLEDLLDVFWQAHDPTTPNRQGADVGPQYRSIILYKDAAQKAAVEASVARANQTLYRGRIVTQIVPLETFYKAEDYHQDYFKKNPNQPYCQVVIRPKLQKLEGKGVVPKNTP